MYYRVICNILHTKNPAKKYIEDIEVLDKSYVQCIYTYLIRVYIYISLYQYTLPKDYTIA